MPCRLGLTTNMPDCYCGCDEYATSMSSYCGYRERLRVCLVSTLVLRSSCQLTVHSLATVPEDQIPILSTPHSPTL